MRAEDFITRELLEIKREMRRMATSTRLSHSSIENGALTVKDDAGQVRSIIGKQADGTVAVTYSNGPTPGAPSAPTIIAHQLSFVVQWDGTFEGGQKAPKDLSHVELHVSETADASGAFVPSIVTLSGTLEASGGALPVVGDNDPHYVCLVAVSTSGKRSDPSDFQSVTPLPADVVIGDELIGVTVTGGVVRTAASGARIELNADESVQDLSFYATDGGRAVIRQQSFTNDVTGAAIGSGVALTSEDHDFGAGPMHSELDLAPDRVALEYKHTEGAVTATIRVSDSYASLSSPVGTMITDDQGAWMASLNADGTVDNFLRADSDGATVGSDFAQILAGSGGPVIGVIDQATGTMPTYLSCDTSNVWQVTGKRFDMWPALVFPNPRAFEASLGTTTALSSTVADVCTINLTTTVANTVVEVNGSFDFSATAAGGNAIGQCAVDGTAQSRQAVLGLTASARACVAQTWLVTLASVGSHTIKLRASTSGTANVNAPHSSMVAHIISGG